MKFHLLPLVACLTAVITLTTSELPPGYQGLSASEKLDVLWNRISAQPYALTALPTAEPGKFDLLKLLLPSFDRVSFTRDSDEMPEGRKKLIHTYGSAAKVQLKIFDNSTYTGIFKSGGVGIARLSLAKQDYVDFTPGMGLKILVDGQRSQNFQIMFSVDGQGSNRNFFHNNFSNIIPPPRAMTLKILAKAFALAAYSLPGTKQDRPESTDNLGLYEQASVTSSGQSVSEVRAPYVVNFIPNPAVGWSPESSDDLRIHLSTIPQGSVLYTITVRQTSDARDEVIGQLVTTSGFIASAYEDSNLFFQHAAKRWRA